jgi:hypothetical protein
VSVKRSRRRQRAKEEPTRGADEEHGWRRTRVPTPARRLLVVTFALILAAAGVAFAVGAFRSGPTPIAGGTPSAGTSAAASLTGEPRITAEIPLLDPEDDFIVGGITVGAGSAWVGLPRGGASSLVRID